MSQLLPIESSMLSHHAYDADSQTMTVRYHNGDVWKHDGVPPEKNAAFLAASSKGSYFNKNIRSAHPGRKA